MIDRSLAYYIYTRDKYGWWGLNVVLCNGGGDLPWNDGECFEPLNESQAHKDINHGDNQRSNKMKGYDAFVAREHSRAFNAGPVCRHCHKTEECADDCEGYEPYDPRDDEPDEPYED